MLIEYFLGMTIQKDMQLSVIIILVKNTLYYNQKNLIALTL